MRGVTTVWPRQPRRRSEPLAAISAATASWLSFDVPLRATSPLWPPMAISGGADVLVAELGEPGVAQLQLVWWRVLPPE